MKDPNIHLIEATFAYLNDDRLCAVARTAAQGMQQRLAELGFETPFVTGVDVDTVSFTCTITRPEQAEA